jgi:serine/threonine-protein kinase
MDLTGKRARASAPPATIFRLGTVLSGIYELRDVLGSGSNGQVFDAQDRALNRRVAIKAAWPDHPGLAPLLRKEAQALAAIRHPSIVGVHAMGQHEGIEYFVMEHVLGVTLDEHVRRRQSTGEPIALGEALDVLVALSEGLAAIHRGGIAHRDVKPANVLLAPGPRVVLADLGLVLSDLEGPTRKAQGTPNYMAPESILGSIAPGAARLVDVYALGVLAFWLVAGKLPFEAKTSMEVARLHVEARVPELTGAPPKLAELVAEMLAKDPLLRPQQLEGVSFRLRALRGAIGDAKPAPSSFRVLIVDDDRDIAKMIKITIRAAVPKADVEVATSAHAALEMVRHKAPDLMVLDLQMPGMNGIELYMALRGEHLAERCTVVAASAAAKPADVELLYSLGVARFVEKGANFRAAIAAVAKEIHAAAVVVT